jgi:hypothetical protein
MKTTSQRRYRVLLITAESEASRFVRYRRLIRFPQLTMPLLAAHTPDHWEVSHTDEIAQRVDFDRQWTLLASPPIHLLRRMLTDWRVNSVDVVSAVVIGGPHATLMPD